MIVKRNFRVLHRTVPVTHRTRVDEDGVPTVVQYCDYESYGRWFWISFFNGESGHYGVDSFPLLEAALASERSYDHRKQPPMGSLRKDQLRTGLSMEFIHTMYEAVDAFFELHADLIPCPESD